ncbi:hypothetical protein D2E26_0658 [Bifidobacterium dolichotidis]|uniref:Uncharacterized protein n=1 Tax=Bifidobacterium dolichotidis TaxID=2306976 RepID=A0A430FTE9_9BIFI|nr:hypothetical protein [Bifidobacterium dolichotidis]RSX56095.1 hypothetical protein D2E26_0658 [Bifidobacterium dolichotidis]
MNKYMLTPADVQTIENNNAGTRGNLGQSPANSQKILCWPVKNSQILRSKEGCRIGQCAL